MNLLIQIHLYLFLRLKLIKHFALLRKKFLAEISALEKYIIS